MQLIASYFYFKSVSEGVASYSVLAYQYEWHMMEVAIARREKCEKYQAITI